MEDSISPSLQTRAITRYFQTRKWEELPETDFTVIMPIPHFNKLRKPLVLPHYSYYHMLTQAHEYITMWRNMSNYGIKPWDVRGEILADDVNAMKMLDILERDSNTYRERKLIQDQKNQDYINEQKARHQRAAAGRGGRR
jgi:gamma-glutamylcyclotransferase (GGCT)/AIG2-like uncharacterized protein YtfP